MTAANRRLKPWHVLALLLLTLLTALPPLLLVPPTTKSDETYHWAYATYVAQTGALPPYLSPDDATSREAHQPPLYYALAALLTRHFADPDAFANRVVNQFFMTTTRGNRNFDILGPDAAQAFRIGRWLSLAFWLCVPLAALWAWRPILGARGSLTAAALIALTPLQAFVGTSYSNDMPSVAFMAVAVGALLRLLDPKRAPQWRWCILLGVSLGLSMLSKLYALPLMGAIGVIAITPIPKLEARRRWQLLAALALAVVLMVPWMLDSYRRFGDPLGMSVFSQIMGRDPAWYRPSKIVTVAIQAWRTFWGDVGPGGVDAIPGWMAVGLAVMEVVALAGIVRWWRRARRGSRYRTIALLLGLWVLLALASFAWTFLRAQVTVISGGRNILYLQLVNAPLLVFGLAMWIKTERTVRAIVVGRGSGFDVVVVDLFGDSLPHTAARAAHVAARRRDRSLRGPVRPAGLAGSASARQGRRRVHPGQAQAGRNAVGVLPPDRDARWRTAGQRQHLPGIRRAVHQLSAPEHRVARILRASADQASAPGKPLAPGSLGAAGRRATAARFRRGRSASPRLRLRHAVANPLAPGWFQGAGMSNGRGHLADD